MFAVKPLAQLELLAEFDAFGAASAQVKALRAAQSPGSAARFRIMFADNPLAAEDLLLQVRDPAPAEDD